MKNFINKNAKLIVTIFFISYSFFLFYIFELISKAPVSNTAYYSGVIITALFGIIVFGNSFTTKLKNFTK